ncbi:hypothetical protein ACGFX8_24615 [Streptomyces sp. NPDC048362]|uniref:hypothetical protein n=1 Tax=Streptomyces sp. NPDC048362 TaxID=3365539 RepID=UPI0037128AAB
MKLNKARKRGAIALLVALGLVAILAAVSTFPAALYAAKLIHLPTFAAYSWAALPDLATVVGLLGALILTDSKGRRFAILSVVVFAIASGLVNVAHALSGEFPKAPIALLVAYGLTAAIALCLSAETAARVVASLVNLDGEEEPEALPVVEAPAVEAVPAIVTMTAEEFEAHNALILAEDVAAPHAERPSRTGRGHFV